MERPPPKHEPGSLVFAHGLLHLRKPSLSGLPSPALCMPFPCGLPQARDPSVPSVWGGAAPPSVPRPRLATLIPALPSSDDAQYVPHLCPSVLLWELKHRQLPLCRLPSASSFYPGSRPPLLSPHPHALGTRFSGHSAQSLAHPFPPSSPFSRAGVLDSGGEETSAAQQGCP